MKRTIIRAVPALLLLGLPPLLIPANAPDQLIPVSHAVSTAGLAFARYIASVQRGSAFSDSEPVAVVIEASLPGLYKESALLAIRQTGESSHSKYHVLEMAGDTAVLEEVIAPFLLVQKRVEDMPAASVGIIPANYKFKYVGEVGSGDATAYVFRITPKKKRAGLMEGQLWIDATSGAAVLQAGHFVKPPSAEIRRMELVRDTTFLDGDPYVRTTHVTMDTQRLGRGELTITEYRLAAAGDQALPQLPGGIIRQ